MDNSNAHILFVDDEALILRALERLSQNITAHCHFCESGAAALALMEEQAIDVVVSDMQMPEMSGAEFLAEVAARYPDTIRIVLTGHTETEMVMSAVNEGRIWGFITKPWDDNHLLLSLEQAIFTQQALGNVLVTVSLFL